MVARARDKGAIKRWLILAPIALAGQLFKFRLGRDLRIEVLRRPFLEEKLAIFNMLRPAAPRQGWPGDGVRRPR